MIHIREASGDDLPALGRLFDEYRQFYRLPGDLEKANAYLKARLASHESMVLVAADDAQGLVGFTQ